MTTAQTILQVLQVLDKITTCAFYLLGGLVACGLIAEWVKNKMRNRARLNAKTLDSDEILDSKTEDEMLLQSFRGYTDERTSSTFGDDEEDKQNCSDDERCAIQSRRRMARNTSISSKILTLYVKKIIEIEQELAELFPLFQISQEIDSSILFTKIHLKDCGYEGDEYYYQKYSNLIPIKRDFNLMPSFFLMSLKHRLKLGTDCLQIEPSEFHDAMYLVSRHFIGLNTICKRLIKDYDLLQYHCWQKQIHGETMTNGEEYFCKMHRAKLLSKKLERELPINFEHDEEAQLLKI
jgi:hypothetical protein